MAVAAAVVVVMEWAGQAVKLVLFSYFLLALGVRRVVQGSVESEEKDGEE